MKTDIFFVSYPRSGSQWLNCSMELYFNRPRDFLTAHSNRYQDKLTFLDKNRTDYLWTQTHDNLFKLDKARVIYLYRDPTDVIYSYISGKRMEWDKDLVDRMAEYINLISTRNLIDKPCALAIKYNDIKDCGLKISSLFGLKHDEAKFQECLQMASKSNLIDLAEGRWKNFFSNQLINEDYKDKREVFRSQFKKNIDKKVWSEELLKYKI